MSYQYSTYTAASGRAVKKVVNYCKDNYDDLESAAKKCDQLLKELDHDGAGDSAVRNLAYDELCEHFEPRPRSRPQHRKRTISKKETATHGSKKKNTSRTSSSLKQSSSKKAVSKKTTRKKAASKKATSKKATSKKATSKKQRVGPADSATLYRVGTRAQGQDGKEWKISQTSAGIKRWIRC